LTHIALPIMTRQRGYMQKYACTPLVQYIIQAIISSKMFKIYMSLWEPRFAMPWHKTEREGSGNATPEEIEVESINREHE
jgi:hypothetical protein